MKRSVIVALVAAVALATCMTSPSDRGIPEPDPVSIETSDPEVLQQLREAAGGSVCILGRLEGNHYMVVFRLPREHPSTIYGNQVMVSLRWADALRAGMEVPGFHRICGALENLQPNRPEANDYLLTTG